MRAFNRTRHGINVPTVTAWVQNVDVNVRAVVCSLRQLHLHSGCAGSPNITKTELEMYHYGREMSDMNLENNINCLK